MQFSEAVKTCLIQKPFTFSGRASRSEYWWFYLFLFVLSIILQNLGTIGNIANFCIWIPQISAATRRLHDSNLSGWFQLLPIGILCFSFILFSNKAFISGAVCLIACTVVSIYLYCRKGTSGANRFGESVNDINNTTVQKIGVINESIETNKATHKKEINLRKMTD